MQREETLQHFLNGLLAVEECVARQRRVRREVDLGTSEIVEGFDEPSAYLREFLRRQRVAFPPAGRSPAVSTPRSICAGTRPT